jgi:hypothetical protein
MRKYLAASRKGFVSLYFLGFLLYITSISTAVAANDCCRIRTISNLKTDAACFAQESEAIAQFKCDLTNGMFDDQKEERSSSGAEIQNETAYIELDGDYPEMMIIYFERESRQVIDYESIRYF